MILRIQLLFINLFLFVSIKFSVIIAGLSLTGWGWWWGAGIPLGYYECGPQLLSQKNRTKRNPQLFDSPPTSCIHLATYNLTDIPDIVVELCLS